MKGVIMGDKVITVIPASEKKHDKETRNVIYVAAYARVSTLSSEQEESYESQKAHFEEVIGANPNWRMADIYSDQASGLNTKKRAGFQKMMRAARRGAFKILLVKSISRFSRNTLDSVACLRQLRDYGVDVHFEKEGICTGDSNGELLLTMLSAFAQSESESISSNTTLGFRYKHARGEWSMRFDNFLGYRRDSDGSIVIEEEGAQTVRLIYSEFLSGVSLTELVKKLEAGGRLTGSGGKKWTKTGLSRILSQEKYCGDVLIQKYVMGDVISKKKIKNEGQAPQYYVQDDHPAIVTRQDHLLAKGELMRREKQFFEENTGGPAVMFGKYDFTYKIICPVCGANYNHRTARRTIVWECFNRIHGGCRSEIIKEEELKKASLKAVQILYDTQPGISMNKIPELTTEDCEEKLVEAAILFAENTFAGRVKKLLDGKRPGEYSSEIPRKLVEGIEISDTDFIFRFYGDLTVRVKRSAPGIIPGHPAE